LRSRFRGRDYDTVVQCKKCGKKQYLNFINGLRNGWSICCGYTMPIIHTKANIERDIDVLFLEAITKDCQETLLEG